jgi:hypothetical protein
MSAPARIPQADLTRALMAAKAAGFAVVRARSTGGEVEYVFSHGTPAPLKGTGDEVELD